MKYKIILWGGGIIKKVNNGSRIPRERARETTSFDFAWVEQRRPLQINYRKERTRMGKNKMDYCIPRWLPWQRSGLRDVTTCVPLNRFGSAECVENWRIRCKSDFCFDWRVGGKLMGLHLPLSLGYYIIIGLWTGWGCCKGCSITFFFILCLPVNAIFKLKN